MKHKKRINKSEFSQKTRKYSLRFKEHLDEATLDFYVKIDVVYRGNEKFE